jgi:hypothetical protein
MRDQLQFRKARGFSNGRAWREAYANKRREGRDNLQCAEFRINHYALGAVKI